MGKSINAYKVYSDATLQGKTNEELIGIIRTLEHNYEVALEFNDRQAKNFVNLMNGERGRIIKELEKASEKMSTCKYPHTFYKAVGTRKATQIVKGGTAYGGKHSSNKK